MQRTLLSSDWKFHLGDIGSAFETTFDTSDWESVTLPHDWSVAYPKDPSYSSGTGYVRGGIGWYKKSFALEPKDTLRTHFLCFDGVYKNSRVWLNGYYLGERPNGYINFSFDVTDFLYYDGRENVVSVKVSHEDIADSRWFTGSGITRKVELVSYDIACPEENSVFFTAKDVCSDSASFSVSAKLFLDRNFPDEFASGEIKVCLLDADGKNVLSARKAVELNKDGAEYAVDGQIIYKPHLWSVDDPYLYMLRVFVCLGDNEALVYEGRVGFRDIRFDANEGFFLNGKNMLLKGVCVHHDGGALGAAVTKNIWERRLKKLKKMGANAIRMSHNPHMPELFDLCDEMGFLVIDEAFDEWEGYKNKWHKGHNVYPPKHQGYAENFPEWHERDLISLVCRDRNHPSVIMWSIGNEIDYPNDPYNHPSFLTMTGNNDKNKPAAERKYHPGRPNMERLTVLCEKLCDIVKRYDATRPVSAAVAFPELSTKLGYIDPMDVVGYNYKEQLYDEHHALFPDKPFLGSENGHSFGAWKAVTDRKFISGQFLWTGIDFLGECPGWPYHSSSAGNLNTAGFEKARYFERMSWWSDEPVLHLVTARFDGNEGSRKQFFDSWNYIEGEKVEVRAYSNAGLPSLSVNGKPAKAVLLENGENGYYSWSVEFESGKLLAQCENGTSFALETTGAPAQIKLTDAGSCDICQVEVNICDALGRRVPLDMTRVQISIKGDAEYLGMDNGDVSDVTFYRENIRHCLNGQMMIYLRKISDEISITVQAPGLKEGKIKL
ncbi:MAG: beta galactosidase jelly roll domain-containing protein [Clostridia bacterium]|nr:beta galactosidase jelly roll domain-containing protein [Clostridia bacterium]